MALRKATRQMAKMRLGLSAVSGGGKTVGALRIGFGITGDWEKIAIIDTENESADLYANHTLDDGFVIGEFLTYPLKAPYTPEAYIKAIQECESAGMEVVIVDSISHEWDGKGGCLEIVDKLGGKFQDWSKVTPRHQAFIDSIVQCRCHMITTVRRKQDYQMTSDGNKVTVQKAGLKEVTREGFEYELTANFEIDQRHNAIASKDRTGLFADKPAFLLTEKIGEMIKQWCNSGVDINTELADAIKKLDACETVDDLTMLKETLPGYIVTHQEFKNAGNIRYGQITKNTLV